MPSIRDLLSLLSLTLACGCATLADVSSGHVGCPPSQIRISNDSYSYGSRTWTATCHGRQYACSAVATGRDNSQVNCAPMGGGGGGSMVAHSSPSPSPRSSSTASGSSSASGSRPGSGSATVKRGYDEERHAHFVTGRFEIARGLNVIISGAPKVSMGTIAVTLFGVSHDTKVRMCEAVQVLINGEPFSTERNVKDTNVSEVKIESRFDFSVFQPLAERFPVFGVRACGVSWGFTPDQLDQLRALLAVYSDLAKKVQEEGETPTTAPGQTTL